LLCLFVGAGPIEFGLAATLGWHPGKHWELRMPLSEGLAGLVAETGACPVAVDNVKKHPRFKYFKESGEEEYNSFLGVPLIDRNSCRAF